MMTMVICRDGSTGRKRSSEKKKKKKAREDFSLLTLLLF